MLFCKADPCTVTHIAKALEDFHQTTGLHANMTKSRIYFGGCDALRQNQCLSVLGFQEADLPISYLGVPITAGRMSKLECRGLADKIMTRLHIWSTRSLSFAGRAQLINSVIFGMFNYWASIFILPQALIDQITRACRNFLWGGTADYKKPPYISWDTICLPKKFGGLGLKHFGLWNKACMAKLVWMIAMKKDNLWVKWVHGKYLHDRPWTSYTPPRIAVGTERNCLWLNNYFPITAPTHRRNTK